MQNKCLKDSSVLEGIAETQQSQYKPDVSQQVLGGEMCSLRVWELSGGAASYNTDTATIKEGRTGLSRNLPTEGLMLTSFKAPPSFILQHFNRAPMRYAQHLVCVKHIYFQNSAEPTAPETLKLSVKASRVKSVMILLGKSSGWLLSSSCCGLPKTRTQESNIILQRYISLAAHYSELFSYDVGMQGTWSIHACPKRSKNLI